MSLLVAVRKFYNSGFNFLIFILVYTLRYYSFLQLVWIHDDKFYLDSMFHPVYEKKWNLEPYLAVGRSMSSGGTSGSASGKTNMGCGGGFGRLVQWSLVSQR